MDIEDISHIGEIWAGVAILVFIILTLLSRFSEQDDKLEFSDVVLSCIFWPIFIPMVIFKWFIAYGQYFYNKITRYED